jgi:hypothetical protein
MLPSERRVGEDAPDLHALFERHRLSARACLVGGYATAATVKKTSGAVASDGASVLTSGTPDSYAGYATAATLKTCSEPLSFGGGLLVVPPHASAVARAHAGITPASAVRTSSFGTNAYFFGFLLISPRAFAADPVDLIWNAPAGCPSRDAVLAEVVRILGGPPSRPLVAHADVTEMSADHFSLHLTTDVEAAQGERTLDTNSCASLAQAAALILAWTIDPTRVRTAVER